MEDEQMARGERFEREISGIARGTGINFGGKLIGGALQYAHAILAARILGAAEFGQLMLGWTIITLIGSIARLGLDGGAMKYVALYNGIGRADRVKGAIVGSLRYAAISSTLAGVIVYCLADSVMAHLFSSPALGTVMRWFAISLPFGVIMIVAAAATQGFREMKYNVYVANLVFPSANLILTGILYLSGYRLLGVAAAYSIAIVLSSIAAIGFLLRCFPGFVSEKSNEDMKEIVRFSLPILLSALCVSAITWIDTTLLGYFRKSEEVGIYNAATRTAFLTGNMATCINTIFAPMICDLYNRQKMDAVGRIYATSYRWIVMASYPVFLMICLLSEEIMRTFGRGFEAGTGVLMVLTLSQMANAGAGLGSSMLLMSGRERKVMLHSLLGCLLSLGLNMWLIPRYGSMGAAGASFATMAYLQGVLMFGVYRSCGMHPYEKGVLKALACGSTAFFLVALLKWMAPPLPGVASVMSYAGLYVFLYAAAYRAAGLDEEDRWIMAVLRQKAAKIVGG